MFTQFTITREDAVQGPLDDFDLGPQSDEEAYDEDEYGEADEGEIEDEDEINAELGRICIGCGREFVAEHGFPALCEDCQHSKPSLLEGDVRPATHPLAV